MRLLLISVLNATLTGCTCFSPQQAQQARQVSLTGCTEANGFACPDGADGTPQTDSKPPVLHGDRAITANTENLRHRRKASTHTKIVRSHVEPKTEAPQPNPPKMDVSPPVQSDIKSDTGINAKSKVTEATTESPQSSQLEENSDSVIKKARATIAATLERPTVEFVQMKRVAEKDTIGKSSIDIICGYVREKNASGENTAERPFLYLVQKDRAYIGDMMATTDAYKYLAICLAKGQN
jgi:hypothetical protein